MNCSGVSTVEFEQVIVGWNYSFTLISVAKKYFLKTLNVSWPYFWLGANINSVNKYLKTSMPSA